jgi:hypothetical protein
MVPALAEGQRHCAGLRPGHKSAQQFRSKAVVKPLLAEQAARLMAQVPRGTKTIKKGSVGGKLGQRGSGRAM